MAIVFEYCRVILGRKQTLERLKKELLEQQCVEEKLTSLIGLLEEPLKQLGSDPPPSATPQFGDPPNTVVMSFLFNITLFPCIL
jgi:hypothetical protein